MNIPNDIDVFDCTNATVWKGIDGYIYVKNKSGIYIDLGTHKETFTLIKKLCGDQRCGLIVDMNGIDGMSKESRDYSRAIEHLEYVAGVVLLISNPVSRLIANFFLGINAPKHFPVHMFTDLDKARNWLQAIESKK